MESAVVLGRMKGTNKERGKTELVYLQQCGVVDETIPKCF